MAVQFILGRSGAGKTTLCMKSIIDALAADGPGSPGLALLVPEQATWQAERAILADHRIVGYSRLRILSFNRLMFHLLGPGAAQPEISRLGRQMAVHKVLRANAGRLGTFGRTAHAPGLAAELTKTIVELHEYEQQPDDVARLADTIRRTHPEHSSADKFADLALIYRSYLDFIESHAGLFVNPDARLTAVRQNVRRADWLRGVRLWVDGFSSFTAQQRQLLVELLKVASESAIALCLDPADFDWRNPDKDAVDPADLFAGTRRTYADLFEAVTKSKLPLGDPVILDMPRRFASSPALAHVEKSLFAPAAADRPSAGDAVRIVAAPSARAEVNWIAREIHRLVRRENCRFRDIAVVVSDIASYQHYIEAAFTEYGIPFFIDRPKPLAEHPVIELIAAALHAALGGLATADVMAFLKTRLTGVGPDEIDRLENYCLAHGINGDDWLAEEPWDFAPPRDKQFDSGDIDRIRRRAVAPLVKLKNALSPRPPGQGITAEAFTRAVWECLESLHVREQIARWCDDDPDDRHGHRQFYEKFVAVFDELTAIFADESMPAADFAAILAQAVAALALKLIPSRLDQVLVGAIERSRHPDLGVVFLAGATLKMFPTPVTYDAVLTDDDREIAEAHDLELADRLSRQLASRQYLAYIAFTRPSRRLYVTYPTMDGEGRSLVRSSCVDHLTALFCDLRAEGCVDGPSSAGDIYGAHQLKALLCERLGRDGRDGDSRRDLLTELHQGMCSHPDRAIADAAERVRRALEYDNRATLDGDASRKLVGGSMECSVTRLGAFAACPFRHFARYMLNIDTRKLFRFEPVDLGMFYHRVLDGLYRALDGAGKDLATVDGGELLDLCRRQIACILQTDAFLANFRSRGAHNAYVLDSAARTLEECVAALAEMSRAGRFRQRASELRFGGDAGSPVCQLRLPDGRTVGLHGSIDRVDLAESDGKQVALVFDYKRREQSVSWSRLYHGLDMQLAVYMLALEGARVDGEKVDAVAGAFFVPIEIPPATETISGMDAQMDKFKYKVKGIVDGRFADLLDTNPCKDRNRYYNFAIKDGAPYGRFSESGVLRSEQFDAVLSATKQRIIDFAQSILTGQIDVRPYRMGRISPCSQCDYPALCRFDWQINDYRVLENLRKEAVLERIGGLQ